MFSGDKNHMKSNTKGKRIILVLLGILLILAPISANNHLCIFGNDCKNSDDIDSCSLDKKNPRNSGVSGKIHINNNWTAVKAADICTGNGTSSEPYVLKDLIIDGEGLGSCIWIENSDAYVTIYNCTVYNSGGYPHAGIRFINVTHSSILGNNCSFNSWGIYLNRSNDNIIFGNTAIYNTVTGIYLLYSNENLIWGNTATNNNNHGIAVMMYSHNNNVTGNFAFDNGGYGIDLENSNENLIEGNYAIDNNYGIRALNCYYNNITGNILNSENYLGIYMSYCDYNTIMGNVANNNKHDGIELSRSNNNNVTENIADNNEWNGIILYYGGNNNLLKNNASYNEGAGIYLYISDYNNITENVLTGNDVCIYEHEDCVGNIFENNNCSSGSGDNENDGEEPSPNNVPGYNLFFLIGVFAIVAILLRKKLIE